MAIEVYPLAWPTGWLRTRPHDRKSMGAWSRTANQYRDALGKEKCHINRVYESASKLQTAGIVQKAGGKYRLREIS